MTTTTSTGINIAAFRAMSREDQALRWKTYTYETKFELCREARKLLNRSYTSDVVDEAVKHWDAKFAAEAAPLPASTPTYTKEIVYDRETRDYAMYLDGELVGFEPTYHRAEIVLDQLVFELMSGQYFRQAA